MLRKVSTNNSRIYLLFIKISIFQSIRQLLQFKHRITLRWRRTSQSFNRQIMLKDRWLLKETLIYFIPFIHMRIILMLKQILFQGISRRHSNSSKTNNFIFTRQLYIMWLSTKLREIKFMRHTTKVDTNNFLSTINLSINSIQERSTKYDWTKIILWRSKNKKISRVFDLTAQDFNISDNTKW